MKQLTGLKKVGMRFQGRDTQKKLKEIKKDEKRVSAFIRRV